MAMKIKILFGIINYKSTAVYQKKTNKKNTQIEFLTNSFINISIYFFTNYYKGSKDIY